ncbi:hypothetical protein [Leptolyngbya sp. 7M]|nr:hypothetical protein [Leptolyngbya sp. 7M]QYO64912.1 hypothetical protein JVX88_36160 [Leptolyngbya sp. 7M]
MLEIADWDRRFMLGVEGLLEGKRFAVWIGLKGQIVGVNLPRLQGLIRV